MSAKAELRVTDRLAAPVDYRISREDALEIVKTVDNY